MEEVSTDSLRALAPKWSLAGDDQLLNLLQKTHQKVISKCQDVNSKLDAMASALDDASINLQNVNNKFMALSNSQFIESRVYDDDADLMTDSLPVKLQEPPQPIQIDELSMLKSTLAILERAHETAEILDDSDSDSDAEISVVLKPKDMYSHRPLPYIIGSQMWKNKWHAGLIQEDSDTDSSASKQDRDIDQYSESESESEEMTRPPLDDNTVSESSSSVVGYAGHAGTAAPASTPAPADIAAALALRLAAPPHTIAQKEPEEYSSTAPVQPVRKLYRPEQPATSAIFLDEPPPLDNEVDSQSTEDDDDDDIFAEINKHTPYTQRSTVQSNVTEDLFKFDKPKVEKGDIFSDFAPGNVKSKPFAKPKTTLFEGESEPELFEPSENDVSQTNNMEKDEANIITKKPVGGISLFGSNKGTESIGAAILKRNQRKSSTSGDESGSEKMSTQTDKVTKPMSENKPKIVSRNKEKSYIVNEASDETDNKTVSKKEKDIFDDLFSKPGTTQKKPAQKIAKEQVKENVSHVKEKEKTNVKDLFSDNLFDDIDDIFTRNVKITSKNSNQKSIFADDDDFFSDISTPKTSSQNRINNKATLENNKTSMKDSNTIRGMKSIFDSDDELFSDIKITTEKPVAKNIKDKILNLDANIEQSSINNENVNKIENFKKSTEITKERNLFDDSPQSVKPDSKPQMKAKSIFDSDSDDDIFAKINTPSEKKSSKPENILIDPNTKNKAIDQEELFKAESNKNQSTSDNNAFKEKKNIQSPSLFEEDEIDDLFIAANILKSESDEHKNIVITEGQNNRQINTQNNLKSDEKLTENVFKGNEIDASHKLETTVTNITHEIIFEQKPDKLTQPDQDSNKTNFEKDDISDVYLFKDNLFSTPKNISKDEPNKNTENVVKVIGSDQNTIESVTEKSSKPESSTSELRSSGAKIIPNKKVLGTETQNLKQGTQSSFGDSEELSEEKETSAPETKVPISNVDIFDDIFTEPPAFEKLAESKKSKNINALFDDDSDDESLFFKKNDVISDEKPEIFTKNANFDIFVNEPPAIDVDFSTKPSKNVEIIDTEDHLFNTPPDTGDMHQSKKLANDKEDMFCPIPEKEQNLHQILENVNIYNEKQLVNSAPKRKDESKNFINEDIDDLLKSVSEEKENPHGNVLYEAKKENTIDNVPTSSKGTETKRKSISFGDIDDEGLFTTESRKNTNLTKSEKNVANDLSKGMESDEELIFSSLPSVPKSRQTDEQIDILKSNNENKPTDEFEDIIKSKESPKRETEVRKIGKLNTNNFHINVNALIPGSSPKKVLKEAKEDEKSVEEPPELVKLLPDEVTDSKSKTISNKDDVTDQAKSVTFDQQSESEVLDNNVSKQRARIQVKRRPSTRKARHEAARRSAINFGDDTDNSSSFDEPKPANTRISKESTNINKQDKDSIQSLPKNISDTESKIVNTEDNNDQEVLTETIDENKFKNMTTNVLTEDKVSISTKISETENVEQKFSENKQTTTKVVYVLNDEDIFNTVHKNENTENPSKKIPTQTDFGHDIFKSTDEIKTLGENTQKSALLEKKEELAAKTEKEVYQNLNQVTEIDVKSSHDHKQSLFDDSDEELFNKKKNVRKKTTIFDSDSEEDLFSGKKSNEKNTKEEKNRQVKEKKEVKVKSSLFSDDDDDDLFGVKKDKEPKHKQVPSTSKEVSTTATASKTAEPVFSDPLSMLGTDE